MLTFCPNILLQPWDDAKKLWLGLFLSKYNILSRQRWVWRLLTSTDVWTGKNPWLNSQHRRTFIYDVFTSFLHISIKFMPVNVRKSPSSACFDMICCQICPSRYQKPQFSDIILYYALYRPRGADSFNQFVLIVRISARYAIMTVLFSWVLFL